MSLANEDEFARCGELGRALVAALEAFIGKSGARPADSDELSREVGRMALNGLLVAGDSLDWLNRVHMINGLGEVFGELLGGLAGSPRGLRGQLPERRQGRGSADHGSASGKGAGVTDAISPPHYKAHPSGVECITVAEHFGFCLGNAIKYIWRAGLKGDALEDLEKARWYLDREIARRRGASDGR